MAASAAIFLSARLVHDRSKTEQPYGQLLRSGTDAAHADPLSGLIHQAR
jgi:hypothetical protein